MNGTLFSSEGALLFVIFGVVGIPTMILMFAAPAICKGSRKLKKLWPCDMPQEELVGDNA